MSLQNLTWEEAISLLGRIARGLETTERADDFCNWAKNKMNYEEFLTWITDVYKNRIEK